MSQVSNLNAAQVEVMNMMSFVDSPSAWQSIKKALSEYFLKQLDDEVAEKWDDGTLNESKIQSFTTLHERTPYK